MTKLEALKYMLTDPTYQSPSDQATIAEYIAEREKDMGKGTVKVKVAKAKAKAKPSLEQIKARPKKAVATEAAVAEAIASVVADVESASPVTTE